MASKRFKLVPEMEGRTAHWYSRQRGTQSQLELYRAQAAQLVEGLPSGARVLEVAPGPGYLAIELARLNGVQVTGLDVSHTFVAIAAEKAQQAGVSVDFRQGDVASLPFEAGSFDRIICQAAFKNFVDPVQALDEMHRVLRAGGKAIIQDLSRDATNADIEAEVQRMKLSRWNAFTTRFVLGTMLRRRAHSPAQFRALVAQSAFRTAEIRPAGVEMEIQLTKTAIDRAA